MNNIPKVIHYCWFGGNPLSGINLNCIESWKKFCPDYEIKQWNEKNFDVNSNLYVKEAYESKKWAFIADYVRLFVLYKYGGIYMDTDVEVIKNTNIFLPQDAFSGFETENQIQTAIMGAKKGNEWIRSLLSYYDNKHFIRNDGSLDTTTNVVTITNITKDNYNIKLDNSLQNLNGNVTLYPIDYFCPKDYETGIITITENTYTIHHFNASWHTEEEKKKQKRYRIYRNLFGKKFGNKICIIDIYFNVLRKKGILYYIKKFLFPIFKK